ncbi:hypothetical protein SY83_04890 [Paenibacillus swuensis]|uniref:AraC family transcriptional regulator n=1 Tax=Paenibacillus swuensis TaxID=1178515 RepID=A0A172TFA5_9BACL|nr:response regulator [Paenibacillus swuensis]ANE45745.1 hypothetical protein SY83_04890 [Paenibacillus swuensis]
MLKVLVVDDEHLVRKGLIHIMPWEKFGLAVIGECDNGESALEFMEQQEPDLLFTDLTMPVMDGFELLNEVGLRYPRVRTVVLTCHADFQFVQQALRLGAIDYVLKTQLEKDAQEEVLRRIRQRIGQDQQTESIRVTAGAPGEHSAWGLLLCRMGNQQHPPGRPEAAVPASEFPWDEGAAYIELTPGHFFAAFSGDADSNLLLKRVNPQHWIAVLVRDIAGFQVNGLHKWLLRYAETRLFYDYSSSERAVKCSPEHDGAMPAAREEEWLTLEQRWRSYRWLEHEGEFQAWISAVGEVKPPQERLRKCIGESFNAWNHIRELRESPSLQTENTKWTFWEGMRKSLSEIRDILSTSRRRTDCSPDVFVSILKSLEIISKDLCRTMDQSEVAGRVGLSRGYFSKVFKEVVGLPFQEVLRLERIRRAKELLMHPDQWPIYKIAEETGFQDDAYFSRLFRNETGMLPTEYRTQIIAEKRSAP